MMSHPDVARQQRKHAHYFKNVAHLKTIDVYRVLELFEITDQKIGHALKKLLVAGGRGHKDIDKDIQEAIDALERWKEMRREDGEINPTLLGSPGAIVGSGSQATKPLNVLADSIRFGRMPEGVWTEWHGGPRPVHAGQAVVVLYRDGSSSSGAAHLFRWEHAPKAETSASAVDVVAYQIVD